MPLSDYDNILYQRNEYKRKLNLQAEQIKAYEGTIEKYIQNEKALLNKIESAEKNVQNMTATLTGQITGHNVEKQELLTEIMQLREDVRSLKNGDKGK